MKVDSTMVLHNPAESGGLAAKLEKLGYSGAFSFEGQHDPFLPLAIASQQTSTIELGTGIAVAFARSPMNLAYMAFDLQQMTGGRFVLGLGTQIQAHVEKRFGMPWSKPAARMKEMIEAIRAVWDCWQNGSRLQFEGEFYRHTLMTPVFSPPPLECRMPKIVAAGVGPKMTQAVSEVADGFTVHPFHTRKSLEDITLPAIRKGLDNNPSREDFEISCNVIIGSGETEAELTEARQKIRKQIAFYGSTPAYKPVLDCHGWGDLQEELNRLSKQGEWDTMTTLVTDEIVDAVAIVCERERIAPAIKEKLGGIADRINLVARYTPDEQDWADIVGQLSGE